MEQRERINELKGMVRERRCYSKLLDAINECIGEFAYEYAEEFEATETELRIVAEELVFDFVMDEDVLALELMDDEEE